MFSEATWSRKSIGDVDVVFHDGLYHLFHLVLPNHDFIAHAISDNGLNWRRVDNALFIGHAGSWDDLMLWTMHVSPDPHRAGGWRMFYTGLSRKDQGRTQRIGLAVSDDLFRWRKADVNWRDRRGRTDPERIKEARAELEPSTSDGIRALWNEASCFPLEPDGRYYESSPDDERNWVSFRDPFFFSDGDRSFLLAAARVNHGPIVRRGCVGYLEEVSENRFVSLPPLHAPMIYDDIEVPNLFRIGGEYYLIGSLREDAKIRYWHASAIGEPWRNYHDNVLLPKGNYAGRICHDEKGILLWNFFTQDDASRANNLLPPPKRLLRNDNGQLRVATFEGIGERVNGAVDTRCLHSLKGDREKAFCRVDADSSLNLVSEAGFQGFVFDEEIECFRMRCRLSLTGLGKCGILSRVDEETHDGYYLSLDLVKGIAQFRSWGTGTARSGENMMQFESLQAGFWEARSVENIEIQLIGFGSYHELSIDGRVVLSLADARFTRGGLGFYVETAELRIDCLRVDSLDPLEQTDEHLVKG